MSGEIVISSTTDTADEVNRAAEAFGSEPIQPAVDPAGGEKPNADEALHTQMAGHGPSRPMVTSTTDPEAEVAKVQQELDEEREAKREEYLDPHNRRMRKRINRLTAQKYELQERVAALEAGMSRPAQQNNEQPAQPQTSEQFRQPQSNGTQSQPQQPTHDPAVQELHRRLQENQAKMPQLIAEAKQKYGENLEAELTENGEVPQIAVLHVMTLPNPIDTAWYLSRRPEIR